MLTHPLLGAILIPRKGEIKAQILAYLNIARAATAPAIIDATSFSPSSVKDALSRLILERCIVKLSLRREGLDPQEYRTSEMGRVPKYLYELTPLGVKKLHYFEDKGLVKRL